MTEQITIINKNSNSKINQESNKNVLLNRLSFSSELNMASNSGYSEPDHTKKLLIHTTKQEKELINNVLNKNKRRAVCGGEPPHSAFNNQNEKNK